MSYSLPLRFCISDLLFESIAILQMVFQVSLQESDTVLVILTYYSYIIDTASTSSADWWLSIQMLSLPQWNPSFLFLLLAVASCKMSY